jgi:hypothetical protein
VAVVGSVANFDTTLPSEKKAAVNKQEGWTEREK